ncbi:hypothetical protein KW800_01435 [Candidatus Parcubacteria bacterium]|nr:hypothetical protein [Candidatus Parcubacteria bacterium]
MTAMTFVHLVEGLMAKRKMETVPRDFLVEALEMIDDGRAVVDQYPTGVPSIPQTIELARRLQRATSAR